MSENVFIRGPPGCDIEGLQLYSKICTWNIIFSRFHFFSTTKYSLYDISVFRHLENLDDTYTHPIVGVVLSGEESPIHVAHSMSREDVVWSMRNLTENREAFIAEFEHHVTQKKPVYLKVVKLTTI